jgi:lipopolysaccharide biosynthesis glycosyltransferase
MNIKIAVCHHKDGLYFKNAYIMPIHAGKAISSVSLPFCIGDDSGDNISSKNKSWCELTVLYWMWKNLDADYYGLMHYRRYLSFTRADGYELVHEFDNELANNDLSEANIENECRNYEIITSPIWNVHPAGLPDHVMSGYDFYCMNHYKKDLDVTIEIIKNNYPDFYLPFLETIYSKQTFFFNISVMKKEYFQEYCTFMFGVLEETEKQIDISSYDPYQKRVLGFLAERLTNAYVMYARRKYKDIRICTKGIIALAETLSVSEIKLPVPSVDSILNETVHVCLSFDDNYAPHADVTITSLLSNTNPNQSVHFHILCDDKLSDSNRSLISSNRGSNVNFSFYNVDTNLFSCLPLNRNYISVNTYYRLVIHNVLKHINKVIYIDSDTIVCSNIVELWQEDIEDYAVGGCLDEGGLLQSRRLLLGDTHNYFNAGITVFNIKKINEDYPDVLKNYMENYYIYNDRIVLQDQDILNLTFKDKSKIIPLRWNVNSRIFTFNELDRKYNKKDELDAIQQCGIIHYTDVKKPWKKNCNHPLKDLYWTFRKKSDRYPLLPKEKKIEAQDYSQPKRKPKSKFKRFINKFRKNKS